MRREREERERLRQLAEDLEASKETHPMQWAVFQQIDTSGDGVLQVIFSSAGTAPLASPRGHLNTVGLVMQTDMT